jgi:hypothetical protein
MTTIPETWKTLPGNFHALNTNWLFESDNEWGIPRVPPAYRSAVPEWLTKYQQRIRSEAEVGKGAVHFFLDDYRFESVWKSPHKALRSLAGWEVVFSPDFSLYRNAPLALQLLNVYRNRWCQAFWAYHGHVVIPVVSWSTVESFPFAFLGIPKKSVVAVGTVGVNFTRARDYRCFAQGWEAMLARLQPTKVLSYGPLPEELKQQTEVHCYPTHWEGVAAQKRNHGRTREQSETLENAELEYAHSGLV